MKVAAGILGEQRAVVECGDGIREAARLWFGIEKVSRKKSFINKLSKLASETRENQEKECEQSALDELVMIGLWKIHGKTSDLHFILLRLIIECGMQINCLCYARNCKVVFNS